MNMKWFALLGLLLFLGVAVAPTVNAQISKTSLKRKTIIENFSANYINKAKFFNDRDIGVKTPGIWIILLIAMILDTIFGLIAYIVQLINEGKLITEAVKGFFFILLVLYLFPMQIRHTIWIYFKLTFGDLIFWEFKDTIIGIIGLLLYKIVFPEFKIKNAL